MSTFQALSLIVWAAGVVVCLLMISDALRWAQEQAAKYGEDIEFSPARMIFSAFIWPIVITDLAFSLAIATAVAHYVQCTVFPLPDPKELAERINAQFGALTTACAWVFWVVCLWMIFG